MQVSDALGGAGNGRVQGRGKWRCISNISQRSTSRLALLALGAFAVVVADARPAAVLALVAAAVVVADARPAAVLAPAAAAVVLADARPAAVLALAAFAVVLALLAHAGRRCSAGRRCLQGLLDTMVGRGAVVGQRRRRRRRRRDTICMHGWSFSLRTCTSVSKCVWHVRSCSFFSSIFFKEKPELKHQAKSRVVWDVVWVVQ